MELLVAIAVIGVMVSVVGSGLLFNFNKGRDSKRKGDLQALKTALEQYYNNNKAYPVANCPPLGGCITLGFALSPNYIRSLPQDPKNVAPYVYTYAGTAQNYTLTATLENTNDKDCTELESSPPPRCVASDNYKIGPE